MKRLSYLMSTALLAVLVLAVGCKKDDEEPAASDAVVASFQYEVSPTDWAEITFLNFSQNASSYSWDFGDGNSSTEEGPSHTFDGSGTYSVVLTATGGGGTATKTESIIVTDPDDAAAFLAGTDGKTWYLSREEIALGIGPTPGDNAFWSFGGVTPLGARPCILDDSYTFNPDGTWEKNTENTLFVDSDANGGWLGLPESCHAEGDAGVLTGPNGEDLSAFGNGGSYTYDFNTTENSITIDGLGAYIGLASKTETGDNFIPGMTKTYQIFDMGTGPIADTLNLAIVALDASFSWNFYLLSYHDPADLPPLPSAMPAASFSYVKTGNSVEFTNTSTNASSYSWDFGDGNSSTEVSPTHVYGADGDYTVTLTAMDAMSQSDEDSQLISISSAVFTAADLSNSTGKVWRLDGEGCYIVGPCAGCADWWPGLDAAGVIERACQLDDEFIFFDNGDFNVVTQGMVWAEDFVGGANECIDEGDLASPFDAYASGNHAFSTTDTEVTVNGTGAYIGWNRPYNGGELPGDATGSPASTITYTVHDYSVNSGVERLTLTIDISAAQDGTSFWTMRMIAQ